MHPSEYLTAEEVTELRAEGAEMSTPPAQDRILTFTLDYDDAPFGPADSISPYPLLPGSA